MVLNAGADVTKLVMNVKKLLVALIKVPELKESYFKVFIT